MPPRRARPTPLLAARSGLFTLALVTSGLGACRTETVSSPVVEESRVTTAPAGTVWEVRERGALVGYVVRFREPGDDGRTFFSVRNPSHQELGLVDEHGRAYRYHPHEREPEWLGSGTVLDGVARILDLGEGAELRERLEASAGD